ncbi:MAG: TIGR03960 family B12-binding radical SAM protein [Clostridia bacterium]|nr:TIGR03960 family B12-binding radical SAM protein [Clostridia bacterium]
MNEKIEAMLEKVQKASRYTGGEMNAVKKNWDDMDLRFAFCFPDTYEVAMSHLGMKILYALINNQPRMLCERVCMPWVDMMQLMAEETVPLFSLESRKPVSEFDVVGFTLQYEMSYTNILAMLKMANIPLRNGERRREDPIVVAGGPCAFNPEPLADVIDAFMIGDGEEVMLEVCDIIAAWRKSGEGREHCLKQLAKLKGVYVPSLYDVSYNADGTIASFTPNCEEAPARVEKALVADLDKAFFPEEICVPYTEIIHDRIMLEIMRGCTRGCRFCEAGMLYRPVRERSKETLVRYAKALETATGYEEISLSSLSSGDYTCLPELIRELMREFEKQHVAISLPSLRIDSVLKESLEETQKVRKSGLTFAPEAGTQRLRDVINKGVTEDDLMEKVHDAFSGGWSNVKLYFMIGLPTEITEDLDGIAHLAKKCVDAYFAVPKMQRAKGLRVTCSASSFVPKPFTPFQWEPQDTQEMIKDKQAYLRGVLRLKGVTFNWHEPELSLLEACFSRGDRRMGEVLMAAFERGCMLDGWSEHFKFDKWMEAFEACGLDPAFYAYRRREKDEILPWDFVDAGVTKEFLWREKEKADRAEVTKDCRKGCNGCGLQRYKGVCSFCG